MPRDSDLPFGCRAEMSRAEDELASLEAVQKALHAAALAVTRLAVADGDLAYRETAHEIVCHCDDASAALAPRVDKIKADLELTAELLA